MFEIPDEFRRFGLFLDQDAAEFFGPTPELIFAGALSQIEPKHRPALRDFVDRLLKAHLSEAELMDIYYSVALDWGPRGKNGARRTFQLIRATLDADCKPYYGPLD